MKIILKITELSIQLKKISESKYTRLEAQNSKVRKSNQQNGLIHKIMNWFFVRATKLAKSSSLRKTKINTILGQRKEIKLEIRTLKFT